MRFVSKTSALLLLVGLTACQSPKRVDKSSVNLSNVFTFEVEGKWYVQKLTTQELLAGPRWASNRDRPPLAPGVAAQVATQQTAKLVTDARQWKVVSVTLKRPFESDWSVKHEEYWVYLVHFRGPNRKSESGKSDRPTYLLLQVLMNGSIVPVEPYKN